MVASCNGLYICLAVTNVMFVTMFLSKQIVLECVYLLKDILSAGGVHGSDIPTKAGITRPPAVGKFPSVLKYWL